MHEGCRLTPSINNRESYQPPFVVDLRSTHQSSICYEA